MKHTSLKSTNACCTQQCQFRCPFGNEIPATLERMGHARSWDMLTRAEYDAVTTCMMCGQCTKIPSQNTSEHMSAPQICATARQYMVDNNTMPPSTYAFALDDLHASTRRPVTLFMGDPYHTDIEYAFFPGCQLSGARWKQVLEIYGFLRTHLTMGLMLSCCAIPAHWAGHDDLVTETAEHIVLQWNTLGQPTLVMACASCLQFFQETMPHIPCVSLWEMLYQLREHMPPVARVQDDVQEHVSAKRCRIQDPCGARHNAAWHESTRLLAEHCGVSFEEAPNSKGASQCCGYGGLVWCAQPERAKEATQSLAQNLGEAVGLASCIMCRDRLVSHGKSCLHFFDILPILAHTAQSAHKKPLSLSAKRVNRVRLSREIMNIYGTSSIVHAAYPTHDSIPLRLLTDCAFLQIEPELLEELERKHILHQDVAAAVRAVEAHKKRFLEKESGHYLGAWQSNHVTYWVRYAKDDQGNYRLHDAWSHKMCLPEQNTP